MNVIQTTGYDIEKVRREELADLLKLDMIPIKVYTLIAESVSDQLAPSSS